MSRKRKKKKALPPRAKRLKRAARLQAARAWLRKYDGRNVVASYRKHFGTDWRCAFLELKMLGVQIDPGYQDLVLKSIQDQAEARRRKKERLEATAHAGLREQDERYAFIAGYTSCGFAYGMTWEEWAALEDAGSMDELPLTEELRSGTCGEIEDETDIGALDDVEAFDSF